MVEFLNIISQMENFLSKNNIRIFVFGTLREGERLDYYMEGSESQGLYYTEGQLMESENGSAYIDYNAKKVATMGELHFINYYCLRRIDHLESNWGDFPKAYDLILIPIWKYNDHKRISFNKTDAEVAFCYSRRTTRKVLSGDWKKRINVIQEIDRYLKTNKKDILSKDLIRHINNYIRKNTQQ